MTDRAATHFDAVTLYNLLPAIYRVRDADQGYPLRELLTVIAGQVAGLEEDLAQLYDDQFIETCAEWVIPYIGDLIGYRSLYPVAPKVSSLRAEVANTIAYRRGKGTAAILEQLAKDVTGWPASVVEFFQRLEVTQYMNHLRKGSLSAANLRQAEQLSGAGGPFDSLAHTADVRRIASGRGKYNIPNVGIFLFRVHSFELSSSPAFQVDAARFLFNPVGTDLALFNRPDTEDQITHLAAPVDVPLPLTRRALMRSLEAAKSGTAQHEEYGEGKGLWVTVGQHVLTRDEVIICDLSDTGPDPATSAWAHTPLAKAAIDPELGRLAFPAAPTGEVLVSFHYGFTDTIGGGEYDRVETFASGAAGQRSLMQVPQQQAGLQDALDAIQGSGVVEITGNIRLQETPVIRAAQNGQIEIRAANTFRPTLALGSDLLIFGGDSAEVTLNGLLMYGGSLRIPALLDGQPNRLQVLRLRHCTLLPGIFASPHGPAPVDQPSLVVASASTRVEIEDCILGGLRVSSSAQACLSRSIVDARSAVRVAYAGLNEAVLPEDTPGGALQLNNCTLIGKVYALQIDMASNTIFQAELSESDAWPAPVRAERRQEGCVRFSYLPPGSQTPRRFHCQPADGAAGSRIRPQFTSLRFGDPGYAQLAGRCPREILQGAEDEAEMGAFHDLFQPQRESNLRERLDEYLRFGLEAGIFYAS